MLGRVAGRRVRLGDGELDVERAERLRLKEPGHSQASHLEQGEKRDDEIELRRKVFEEIFEREAASAGEKIGELADSIAEADEIGHDVVRELHLALVEDALKRVDQREE